MAGRHDDRPFGVGHVGVSQPEVLDGGKFRQVGQGVVREDPFPRPAQVQVVEVPKGSQVTQSGAKDRRAVRAEVFEVLQPGEAWRESPSSPRVIAPGLVCVCGWIAHV